MRRLILLVLIVSACSAAPTTAPPDPAGTSDNGSGDRPAKHVGEMPTKAAAGLPVEESFFFVASLGGDYYVILDSPAFNVVSDAQTTDEVVLLEDGGPFAVGQPLTPEGSAKVLAIAKARSGTWEVWAGAAEVCAGELGAPLFVSQSYPHFGTEQGWQDDPATAPKNNAETRASMAGGGFLMAPVVGCGGQADEVLWARPAGMPSLRTANESTLLPEQSAKLLAEAGRDLAWPKARERVLAAYKEGGESEVPEESQSVAQFELTADGDKPGIVLTEVNLVIGDTMCGHGPDSEELTIIWVACKTGLCPVDEEPKGQPLGYRNLAVHLVADFNGDGTFDVVLIPGDLPQNRTLFTIEGDTLIPVKNAHINFNDCPC